MEQGNSLMAKSLNGRDSRHDRHDWPKNEGRARTSPKRPPILWLIFLIRFSEDDREWVPPCKAHSSVITSHNCVSLHNFKCAQSSRETRWKSPKNPAREKAYLVKLSCQDKDLESWWPEWSVVSNHDLKLVSLLFVWSVTQPQYCTRNGVFGVFLSRRGMRDSLVTKRSFVGVWVWCVL